MLDLRYALRQLVRSPGFTAVALLTLTLGMGANTAFFSVLYGVVLRQPPYPAADGSSASTTSRPGRRERRAAVARRGPGLPGAPARLRRHRRRRPRAHDADVDGGGDALAERVKVSRVTPNLFSMLGVAPARGRGIRAGDERAGAMAVISHELWRSHFGGAEDVLDRTVRLNGVEYAIVGVMPAGFAYPEPDMGAWMPLDLSPRDASDRDRPLPRRDRPPCAGRRAPAAARLDLQRVARELQQDAPGAYPADARWSIGSESLRAAVSSAACCCRSGC